MILQSLPPLALFGIGDTEILVVMVVILILFGGNKMPEFARGLGKTLKELRKATGDVEREFKKAMDEAENQLPPIEFPKAGSPTSHPWSAPTIEPANTIVETTTHEQAPAPTPTAVAEEVILSPKPKPAPVVPPKPALDHEYHSDI